MQLSITGKQLDVGSALRSHVESVLASTVDKYFGNAIEATVVFSREGHRFRADISAHVGRGILIQSHAEAGDSRAAFEAACERMGKQLRRHKRRLRTHHKAKSGEGKSPPARQYIIAGPSGNRLGAHASDPIAPMIVARDRRRD